MPARVGAAHRKVEQWAWGVSRSSSRRFFSGVALVVLASILTASVAAAWVARRNGDEVARAQDRQQVASSVTEFRNQLNVADTQIAIILAADDHELPLRQTSYEDAVLEANRALTQAGLVASGQSVADIEALAEGLVRYGRLVQTAREYPASSKYADLATAKRDCLTHGREDDPDCLQEDGSPLPTADSVRLAAEQDLGATAARGADGRSILVMVGLTLAVLVLLGSTVLIAGRTRRWLHWALVGSTLLLLTEVAIVSPGLWSQHRELQSVVGTESDAYDAYAGANAAASGLLDLRALELEAVASGDDAALYDRFRHDAADLIDRLSEQNLGGDDGRAGTSGSLASAVRAYAERVRAVREAVEQNRQDAPDEDLAEHLDTSALTRGSASSYRLIREMTNSTVVRSNVSLTERLDAAADANVNPATALSLGFASAGLATLGVMSRGRPYR